MYFRTGRIKSSRVAAASEVPEAQGFPHCVQWVADRQLARRLYIVLHRPGAPGAGAFKEVDDDGLIFLILYLSPLYRNIHILPFKKFSAKAETRKL